MSAKESKTTVYLAYGALLALGPSLGGFFIGKAIENSKNLDRKIAVKGLSERQLDADMATLVLKTTYNGDDIQDLFKEIDANKVKILDYLQKIGFDKANIQFTPPQITDRLNDRWGEVKETQKRYIVEVKVTSTTNDIALVSKGNAQIGDLLKEGVLTIAEPIYIISNEKFNKLKPEMIAEATKNARFAASQFAEDSGVKVGGIITATQGTFSIESGTKNDSYSHFDSAKKVVRVVTNISFSLN